MLSSNEQVVEFQVFFFCFKSTVKFVFIKLYICSLLY